MPHTSHVPLKTIFSTAILFAYNPNRPSGSLSIILGFPAVSCFSFVCLPASCRSCSLYVARHAFKNKAGNVLDNQTKSA